MGLWSETWHAELITANMALGTTTTVSCIKSGCYGGVHVRSKTVYATDNITGSELLESRIGFPLPAKIP